MYCVLSWFLTLRLCCLWIFTCWSEARVVGWFCRERCKALTYDGCDTSTNPDLIQADCTGDLFVHHLLGEKTVCKILRRTDGSECTKGKVLHLKLKKGHEINFSCNSMQETRIRFILSFLIWSWSCSGLPIQLRRLWKGIPSVVRVLFTGMPWAYKKHYLY